MNHLSVVLQKLFTPLASVIFFDINKLVHLHLMEYNTYHHLNSMLHFDGQLKLSDGVNVLSVITVVALGTAASEGT